MATAKKSEAKATAKEDSKASATVDVEALIAQMKADLMKEIEERTKELDKREKELEKKEQEKSKVVKSTPVQKIDETREVIVRAIAHGTTTLKGREYDYPFSGYNDELPISIKELRFIKSTTPRAFTKPLVIVDDEEACKILGLNPLYEKLACVIDIRYFCEKHTEKEITEALINLPQFVRFELFNTLIELWNKEGSEQYRDYDLARVLRKHFAFDLISYEKDIDEE